VINMRLIIYCNINGFLTKDKKDLILHLLNLHRPLIFCVSESHVTDSIDIDELKIPNYTLMQCISTSSHTGGCMIFLYNNIKFEEMQDVIDDRNVWIKGCVLKFPNGPVDFYVLYRSPSYKESDFLESFSSWVEDVTIRGRKILIIGDFNIDMLENSTGKNNFLRICVQNGLKQLVNDVTRYDYDKKTATCIDFVVTNIKNISHKVSDIHRLSDHEVITVRLPKNVTCNYKSNNRTIIVNTKNTKSKLNQNDLISLNQHLTNFDWSESENDIEILSSKFVEQFTTFEKLKPCVESEKVCDKFIKLDPPYFTEKVQRARAEKIASFESAKSATGTMKEDEMWDLYKKTRNIFVRILRSEKKKYYEEKIEEYRQDPKKLWKVLKSMMGQVKSVNKNKIMETNFNDDNNSDDHVANKFNNFYVQSVKEIVESIENDTYYDCNNVNNPINFSKFETVTKQDLDTVMREIKGNSSYDCIDKKLILDTIEITGNRLLQIINCAIQTGCYPTWKTNMIIPIPKIVNPTEPQHYRPINILPYYEKIVEKLLYKQMISYITKNDLLYHKQSGFRGQHSCETALQGLFSDWRERLDSGEFILTVMLDFKRAFETIDRDILICKLRKFGFGDLSVKLLASYLKDRQQFTKINDVKSDLIENVSGVPQGAVLGPLLFIIYINDLHTVVKNVSVNLFADDTLVYFSGKNVTDVLTKLNCDLQNITQWLKINKLKLNTDKTKAMIISKSSVTRNKVYNEIQNNGVFIEGENIEFVDEFKYLGVVLDQYLSFDNHVNYIGKKIAKKIGVLGRISDFVSPVTRANLYKIIIAPHFEYCSTIMWNMSKKNVNFLQKLQNKAMRIVLRCHKRTHVVDMLNTVCWMSIKQRIFFNTMLLIFKMKQKLVPEYLYKKILLNSDIHDHNTRNSGDIFRGVQISETMNRSIYQSGVAAYNMLPCNVKDLTDLKLFKRMLKEYVCLNESYE